MTATTPLGSESGGWYSWRRLVLVVEDAACSVSGHRDGMCQLALLLSSMAARRMVATVGRGQCAAYLASRRSLHKTRRGSLSSALCAWPLGVHITPRISWHHFRPYSWLGQLSQLQPRHTWFSYGGLAMVQAQEPASWHLLAHASLHACSLCRMSSPRMRCECACSHRRIGARLMQPRARSVQNQRSRLCRHCGSLP